MKMKKGLLAVFLGLLIYAVPMLPAQQQNTFKESEYYYITVPIEKIFYYKNGYIVLYQQGYHLNRTYIPMEWFTVPTGKADMIALGTGSNWPQLTIYYKNGEFSHIRLYVRRNRAHETWGMVPLNVDIDQYFQNIEEIKLEL